MRMSTPKLEVLKELNVQAGVPRGSRFATFDSLLGAGLIREIDSKQRKCEITEEGRKALKAHNEREVAKVLP